MKYSKKLFYVAFLSIFKFLKQLTEKKLYIKNKF